MRGRFKWIDKKIDSLAAGRRTEALMKRMEMTLEYMLILVGSRKSGGERKGGVER